MIETTEETRSLVRLIALEKLVAHPANPNRQSKVTFAKLVRNIELSGRYEPLIVRPSPEKRGFFEIINGQHRWKALLRLGYKRAECIVWDIDDEQTEILLATLNRLCGSDEVGKKVKLLRRLSKRMKATELGKLLPQTAKQIERLTDLRMPALPAKISGRCFANPVVFFLSDKQQEIVESALSPVVSEQKEKTRAARRATALVHIAKCFISGSVNKQEGIK